MDRVKNALLNQHCPGTPPSDIISGYHRGRRRLLGNIYYPDIISIHHLHLHVIVRPKLLLRIFKYPAWLPLMWKSDAAVLRDVRRLVWDLSLSLFCFLYHFLLDGVEAGCVWLVGDWWCDSCIIIVLMISLAWVTGGVLVLLYLASCIRAGINDFAAWIHLKGSYLLKDPDKLNSLITMDERSI